MIVVLKTILALYIAGLSCVNGSRILGIFPIATGSHLILTSKLMKGLAEAGHDVTMISPYRLKDLPKNGKYRDVILEGFAEEFEKNTQSVTLFSHHELSAYQKMKMTVDIMLKLANKTLHNPVMKKIAESNETYDLVIVENFRDDALKIYAHRFNCPLVVLCSMGPIPMVNPTVGNPQPTSYVPHTMLARGFSTSFTNRAKNLMYYLIDYFVSEWYALPKNEEIMRAVFPDAPSIYDLYSNVSLVLLNSHSSINLPVPLVPNMIEVGGYFIDPPKKLPQDLEEYMNNATEGVIYFSMGSIIKGKDLPEDRKRAFLNVFRKLKQKVIWKFEDDSLEVPPNVLIRKWCPQQDILAHPNIRLFITHAGLLSTTEAVHHGVPILAIPVFVDQPLNAAAAVKHGYALQLEYQDPDFSEQKIDYLVNELLHNATYAQNAKVRSQLYHDRPMKPMEAVVYWVNYVIRHRGALHLRVAGTNLPWYKYFMVDVIGSIVLSISVGLYVLLFAAKRAILYFSTNRRFSNISKKKAS